MKIANQFFIDTSSVLVCEYKRSRSVGHKGQRGSNRELFIQSFLERSFPKKYVFGSGEIIDSNNQRSGDCDIVIYDENMPVLDYGKTKHFLSCGVKAHIEVKSKLDKKSLLQALKITESIKNLNKDFNYTMYMGEEPPPSLFSCIFAYDSIDPKKIINHLAEFYKKLPDNETHKVVDVICVVNKWIMLKIQMPNVGHETIFFETKGDSLMVFFNQIFKAVFARGMGVPNMPGYTEIQPFYPILN